MAIGLSSRKTITGILFLSLLLLFHSTVFSQQRQLRYTFALFTNGVNYTDNLFATSQNQQPFVNREAAFHFEGDIYLQQVAVTENRFLFSVAVSASRYQITGAGNDYFSDTAGINEPFFISWKNGKIERMWLHNNTSATTAFSIRMLMSYLQYQQTVPNLNMLETTEDDPNGHCNVLYRFYPKINGLDSAVKEKKQYVQNKEEYDFNELKTSYTPSGNISVLIDKDDPFPVWVSGTEQIITRLSQKIIGTSETSIWIHSKEMPKVNYTEAQLPSKIDTGKNYKASSIYIYTSSRDFRKDIRKDILGQDRLEPLISKLHSRFAIEESDSMVLKLKSLATVYPGMAYPLAAVLDTAATNSIVYKIIAAALLDAETDHAINAVAELAWKHRADWNYVKGLITNTGLNPQVTDSAITLFKSLALAEPMSKTSRASWMALGTMTDNIYKRDSIAGQALWKWISDSLQTLEQYKDNSRVKLLVWGNSNQSAAFDSVIKFIYSDNEEIRSVAVVCTGQFSFDRKIPFLLDVIKRDTVLSIKSNAARSMSGQLEDSSHLLYVKELMASEKDSSIRQSLLNTINIKSREKKLVYEILNDSRHNDSSPTLRLEAADMLRRMDD